MISVALLALAFVIILYWSMFAFGGKKRETMTIENPPKGCASVHGRLVCS